MTTYQSDAVPTAGILQQIELAQRMLNEHAADLNGICVTCHVTSPCAHREPAVAVFFRYFRVSLPQRRPVTSSVPPTSVAWFRNERQQSCRAYDNRKATAYHAAQ